MDSNETIRPLTEVPVEQTSETLVSSSATAEENNATYVPKQTKEEVIERLKEINEDACNADKQVSLPYPAGIVNNAPDFPVAGFRKQITAVQQFR